VTAKKNVNSITWTPTNRLRTRGSWVQVLPGAPLNQWLAEMQAILFSAIATRLLPRVNKPTQSVNVWAYRNHWSQRRRLDRGGMGGGSSLSKVVGHFIHFLRCRSKSLVCKQLCAAATNHQPRPGNFEKNKKRRARRDVHWRVHGAIPCRGQFLISRSNSLPELYEEEDRK
jgi:hypothetical protein